MDWNTNFYPPVRLIHVSTAPFCAEDNAIIRQGLEIFKKRVLRRCGAAFPQGSGDYTISLSLDPAVGKHGFRITSDEASATIAGSCAMAVVYGLGKFLHTSGFSAQGFHPSRWQGTSAPTSPIRGIQLDTHFCNFYHMAPANELAEYVEDLALWGINYVDVVFPFIDLKNWEDPEVEKITGQIRTIYVTAKALGIKVGMEVVPNQDFVERNETVKGTPNPDPTHRRANNGHNICPNLPGAMEYILGNTYGKIFEHLHKYGIVMDFLCFWPYDEGGCGCAACAPWGANGYLKASRAIWEVARTYLPEVKVILSTWLFDTPEEGEWEGLTRVLAEGNDWIDCILADSHDDFPQYPLTHGVPGNLPLINYPEISMWGLHPWGGYGANPLPDRFEMLWHQVKDAVSGGIAYSEGIFDDVNKIVVSQFYWDRDTTADATMREYIGYEYAPFVYDEVRHAIRLIERNQDITKHGVQGKFANTRASLEDAQTACDLLHEADAKLDAWAKASWRWRILVLRAELDLLRYTRAWEQRDDLTSQTTWTDVLRGCEEAKVALTEVVQIFHSNLDYDNTIHPMYRHVRPALMDI